MHRLLSPEPLILLDTHPRADSTHTTSSRGGASRSSRQQSAEDDDYDRDTSSSSSASFSSKVGASTQIIIFRADTLTSLHARGGTTVAYLCRGIPGGVTPTLARLETSVCLSKTAGTESAFVLAMVPCLFVVPQKYGVEGEGSAGTPGNPLRVMLEVPTHPPMLAGSSFL